MTRELLTGNAAAAWGARLADVDYVPAYPITPPRANNGNQAKANKQLIADLLSQIN